MKIKVLLLFGLLSCLFSYSQYSANVEGFVFDLESNTAIKNADVEIEVYEITHPKKTNFEGKYEIKNIDIYPDSAPAELRITYPGYISYIDSTRTLYDGENNWDTVFLEKQPSSIEGTIELQGNYSNVEDAEVILSGVVNDTTYPELSGYFNFPDLEPGEYNISVVAELYLQQDTIVLLDESEIKEVNIELFPIPGKISGNVSIQPIDIVTDVIISLNNGQATTKPDENGIYEFTDISPDTYTVKATLDGYIADTIYTNQILEPGDSIENLNFILVAGHAKVMGTVKNELGVGIENATVIAEGKETKTGVAGVYLIDSLPIGKIDISAFADGYIGHSYQDTILIPGENTIDFTLDFESTPHILVNIPTDSVLELEPTIIAYESRSIKFYTGGINLDTSIFISINEPFSLSLNDSIFFDSLILEPVGSGVDSTQIFVRFEPLLATTYTDSVSLTTSGADTIFVKVTGTGIEELKAEIIASKLAVCPGESVLLEASVFGGVEDTYTYKWYSDIFLSEEPSVIVNPTVETTYTLIVSDTVNNVDSVFQTIEIITEPALEQNPESDSVCENDEALFSIVLDNDNDVSYQWQKYLDNNWIPLIDNDIYSGTNTSELYIQSALDTMNNFIFRCEFARCAEPNYSDSAHLYVKQLPIDTLIVKGSPPIVLISPDSGQFYQWYKDGNRLIGENGQFYYPIDGFEEGSEYYAVIDNEFGCISTTNSYFVEELKSSFVVYPNPVSNTLFIETLKSDDGSKIRLIISDLTGRTVILTEISGRNTKKSITLRTLKNGFYIVKIIDEKGSILYSSKIIKN